MGGVGRDDAWHMACPEGPRERDWMLRELLNEAHAERHSPRKVLEWQQTLW